MHLADIVPAIFSGLGLADPHGRNQFGDSPHGRECLLLIDGLGASALSEFSAFAPSISSLTQLPSVSTAFPSTTATSLTTLMTGELPGAHGMLGYTVRVPRSGGRVLNSLKWDERVDPHIWQPIPTLFERASQSGIHVSHVAAKRYEKTGFTRAAFRGAQYRGANVIEDLVSETKRSLIDSPSFTYVYINQLDVAGHSDGVGSEKWLNALIYADSVVSSLLAHLPQGTQFWLTADHGMMNVTEKVILGEGNQLLTGVSTIAGEPRARHIYLQDEYLDGSGLQEVISIWRQELGARADVYSRQEAISMGLFGKIVSLDSSERMGDIITVAHDGLVLIDPAREKLEGAMVGHHGAMTEIESLVPLATSIN